MLSDELRKEVADAVASEKEVLNFISENVWNHPEVNYEEHYAHDFLSKFLANKGFSVERGYCNLDTAFRANFVAPGGDAGPTVCIICEYDALPELGHACGHNLISEAGVGAALAVKTLMTSNRDIRGKLVVMGTPAEEGGGGKIVLIRRGAFSDIDFAMMVHPTPHDILLGKTLAIVTYKVRYLGREAHASVAPWEGINALDAAVSCYVDIGLCRQQMRPDWRVHTIITKGGNRPNIIPGDAEMLVTIRAPSMTEIDSLKSIVTRCFESAAKNTGCQVEYSIQENSNYETLLLNGALLDAYGSYAESEGVHFQADKGPASTDMGNVSRIIPSIQPYYAIPTKGSNHTKEFAEASRSPGAQPPTLRAARAMACTVIQIFTDPKLQEKAKKDFDENKD